MSTSSSAPTDKPPSVRYESLDFWRGVACLMVVLDHAALNIHALPVPGWQTISSSGEAFQWLIAGLTSLAWGPPMFFVMSGYCACSSLDSTRRKQMPSWVFITRRLWRIFPPYWISLIGLLAVLMACNAWGFRWFYLDGPAIGLGDPSQMNSARWLGNFTLTETWRPFTAPETTPLLINTAAWTLCLQEQFYLICFMGLCLCPRRLHGFLGAATLLITAYVIFRWDSGGWDNLNGLFFQYWHEFACGMAVYWGIHVMPRQRHLFEIGLAVMLVVLALAGAHGAMVAAGFALVMLRAYRWDRHLAKMTRLRLVDTLGKGSYGIYLAHLPFCIIISNVLWHFGANHFWASLFVTLPIALVAGLAGGWVFHRTIERQFAGMPRWLDRLAKRRRVASLPGPTLITDLPLTLPSLEAVSRRTGLDLSGSRARNNGGLDLSGSSLALRVQ